MVSVIKLVPTGDDGFRQAEENASPDFMKKGLEAAKYVAQKNKCVSVDQVRAECKKRGIRTHSEQAYGPLMTRAAERGYLRKHEDFMVKGERTPGVTAWESQIYEPE